VSLALQGNKINLALLWSKYGGNVTSINDLVIGLDKERFRPFFIYLSDFGVDESVHKQGNLYFLSNRKNPGQFNPVVLWRLVRILRDEKVDIVHCHRHKQVIYGAMASCFSPHPVVLAHIHGLNRTRSLSRKVINFLAFKKVRKLVAVSKTVGEDVLKTNWKLSAAKVCVLENSVDYERFANVQVSREEIRAELGLSMHSFVFGTVGRLAPTKGLPYLIEAFSKIKTQIPSAHLIFLGDGSLKPELEKQAGEMQCKDSIHFLGYRTNIEVLLRGIDVFVLSSIAEGMPRVILEAMAARVPCIATKVGGIPDIINDESIGLLVPPKDSVALSQAMIRIAKMPGNELDTLIRKAQDRIRRFYSHKTVSEKLRKLYESKVKNY
jgi:glycosyltransferase involved in cell wall biosynthesis